MLFRRDPVLRKGCDNACRACRACGGPGGGLPPELEEELGARAVGMSYQELETFDVDSSFYDPDTGPFYWEG